jgi:hypothetical protein
MERNMAYSQQLVDGLDWYAELASEYTDSVREGSLPLRIAAHHLTALETLLLTLARAECDQLFRVWRAALDDAALEAQAAAEARMVHTTA